jgi:hypothetical protein
MDPKSDTAGNSGEMRELGHDLLPGVPPNYSKGVL